MILYHNLHLRVLADLIQYGMNLVAVNNALIEAEQFLVTQAWVAKFYQVSPMEVHRAITDRRLIAARVRGAKRDSYILDQRLLPAKFPTNRL